MLTNVSELRLNLPDWARETLGERAALIGLSLPDYILLTLEKAAAGPPPEDERRPAEEVRAEIRAQEPLNLTDEDIVAAVRFGRCDDCYQRYLRGELEL